MGGRCAIDATHRRVLTAIAPGTAWYMLVPFGMRIASLESGGE